MKHIAATLFVYFMLGFSPKAQCDVAITGVNLNTYEVTIEVLNSLGCIANGPGGVNGKVTQLQIGYHLPEPINPDNEIIEDFNETFGLPPCSPEWPGYLGQNPDNNHPGWWYSPSTSVTFDSDIMGDGLVTGDIVTIPLNPPGNYDVYPSPISECGDDLIDYWLSEDECIEFVVWQLNYGNTWYVGNGGWAGEPGGFAPGTYQDQDCDNSWYLCRDENPNHPVASPDIECLSDAPDAVIGNNIEFEIGCIGDSPAYSITYTVFNYGNEEITDYCIEIWNEDWYQCFSSELFGAYGIPPGEGQQFTSPFFEFNGNPGGFFIMSVDSVNDEIITGNNNTTVYFPDEWPECPEVCEPDTVEIETITYIYQVDSIFVTDTVYDTIYIELPPDTLIEYVDNYIYDTTYVDNYVYITDTVYIDNTVIYGCTWPVSCNYNDEATVDDGSCLDCDTPYEVGEILCDEYHGIDGYWDWWIELKGCDIEPPIEQCDTVYQYITEYITEYVTDTIYEYITETEIDTIYITETEYLTDTLYVTEYLTDTVLVDNYIYVTDTITEYIVQEIWIDCETGLPCDEDPPGIGCPDWTTIHAPNTFTPNNDGINDVWKLIYDLNCWEDVEFWIYNRWGNEIYHAYGDSFDSYPYWDGSVNGGNHYVSDGVYVYTFKGKRIGRAEVIQESGHVTVFR